MSDHAEMRDRFDDMRERAEAAEAERDRLREALTYHQCEGPELPCPVCAALAAPTKEDTDG